MTNNFDIHEWRMQQALRELNEKLDWEFSIKMQNYITDELQMRAVKIIFGSLNIQLLKELKKKK